jgi:uncharacterized LabA/DUF88 family protein
VTGIDRFAIFVDAGYLFAAGGELCCGTRGRAAINCNYASLTESLIDEARTECGGLSLLRTYWYDAARDGLPSADQLTIGALPDVKLRLGRLSGGRQKGVDSLIVRDLMTLGRERAIATAYLLSGDEDIREGVIAAQDMGVRVVVLGIPTTGPFANQAATLIREADGHVVKEQAFWDPHFARVEAPPEQPQIPSEQTDSEAAKETGERFASHWATRATPEELLELLGQAPRIPRELDIELLREAAATLGDLREREDLRNEARNGFWGALERARDA